MEYKLTDIRKKEYDAMLKGAQDIEMTIGSTQYRLFKLAKMREDIDTGVKKWWDEMIKELSLDPNRDYYIKDGIIQDITKEKTTPVIPAAKEELKTISDLK